MKPRKFCIPIFLVFSCSWLHSQSMDTKVLKLEEGTMSPSAKISDITWIAGHWRGEALGGIVDEIWYPPAGGQMMGVFRLTSDQNVQFYEIFTVSEEEGSLILKLKHFNADLTGWEEKDEIVKFPLVKLGDKIAYFDGLTMEKIDDNHLTVYVIFHQKDGKQNVGAFSYTKVDP